MTSLDSLASVFAAIAHRNKWVARAGLALLALAAMPAGVARGEGLPRAEPSEVGFDAEHLRQLDETIAQALVEKKMPGCVFCVGRQGKIAWLKAYGNRELEPTTIPMTVDTLFDLASITKPVATACSVMLLVEQGKLGLDDKVAQHIPEFAVEGKGPITIRDLLLHVSGLLPDNALADYEQGPEEALRRICALRLRAPTGEKFIYSDVNFIVLGEIVRRASGQDLHAFTQTHFFRPLGLRRTGYRPEADWRELAAPTEQRDGRWIKGEVHDPRAFKLGGIAGHAGLFSTAEELAVFAQMLLDEGRHGDRRILAAETIATMTRAYQVPNAVRGLGWDKRSGYSSNRGTGLSDSAFGHGGFTGTVLWVDPELELFYVFLSNRVHPGGKGLVNPLAGRLGTIVVDSLRDR